MKFTANISKIEDAEIHWTSIIIIPDAVFIEMIKIAPSKRLICTLNDTFTFHCAMMPRKGYHFMMLGKDKIKKLNLDVNEEFLVELAPDKSEYGIDISEEFQEVLLSDNEGKFLFEKLTSGKQRSLIYLINKIKNSQSRINKSFVILDHLKRNKGTLDLKLLSEDFKNFNSKNAL